DYYWAIWHSNAVLF
nr:immunoglobulin light chain junction region [Macaca mulatta]